MAKRWQIMAASEVGSSHIQMGNNQSDDALAYTNISDDSAVLTVADGAGSAELSRIGSQSTVNTLVEAIETILYDVLSHDNDSSASNTFTEAFWTELINDVIVQARENIKEEAAKYHDAATESLDKADAEAVDAQITPEKEATEADVLRKIQHLDNVDKDAIHKFATTTLGVIITPQWLVSWQIGDGAMVVRDTNGYRTLTQPAKGLYANQTHFLTGETFQQNLKIVVEKYDTPMIDGIVLMTDGLEGLAIQSQDNTPFQPFFDNLFNFCENTDSPLGEREEGLRDTLKSDAVNQRTDDDKTLLVAFLEDI